MGSTKQPSYTETLADVRECLRRIAAQTKPLPELSPQNEALLARMDAQDKRQEEMIALLKEMNGRVREHGTGLAVHGQWIEDHVGAAHTALQKDVEYAVRGTKIVAVVDTILAFIAGILGLSNLTK
jgi:hypothetical protein